MIDDLKSIELNTRITALAMLGNWQSGTDTETMFAFTKLTSQYASHLPPMRGDLDGINSAAQTIATEMQSVSKIDFTPITDALSEGLTSVESSFAALMDFNWNTLHGDLVGIWNAAQATANNVALQTAALAKGGTSTIGSQLINFYVTALNPQDIVNAISAYLKTVNPNFA